jgi:hypothetical protein
MAPIGENHCRPTVHEFVEREHRERNHQGLHQRIGRGEQSGGNGRIRSVRAWAACSIITIG